VCVCVCVCERERERETGNIEKRRRRVGERKKEIAYFSVYFLLDCLRY
jgi:hypothetical protein